MGQLHTCPDEILEMASVYYETLFTSDLLTRDVLDARDEVWSFVRPVVSGDMQTAIMWPFSLQEVTDAVHGLDGASCAGDDGLTRQFFMEYWDLISQPLQEGLQEIFDTGLGFLELRFPADLGFLPEIRANGSARVRLGATDVIASIKAKLGRPLSGRSNQGRVEINIECSPTAAPQFEGRGGDELSLELSRALHRSLLGGAAIDLSALSVIEGKLCWNLFIDGLVLSSDGNLLDVLAIAIKVKSF
ncbi:hypothetical protein L7F22_065359 [Adiantum nelumboides]|nr:hypothetical protein [Adiantum nelumboides]